MNGVANLSLASQSRVGNIAFIDLIAQQRRIRPAVERRLQAVLDHGRYIAGPEIDELEERLAERVGAGAAVACASGTAALIIPLFASGVGEGDAVFIPAFTYNATANAVLVTGATPVFVDIDPMTFNIDPEDLKSKIVDVKSSGRLNPKMIIPVDLFGSPADYHAIAAIAEEEGLDILSDGAQSFGGRYGNRWVGNLAPATATSFFPGKALGAYGDAGAVFGQDPGLVEEWTSIRWHGTDSARKNSVRVGFNGRMDTFQAAVLLEKLAIFDDELAARQEVAKIYNARFSSIAKLQRHLSDAVSSYGYYCLRVDNRDDVVDCLKQYGVPTAIYYATPLHQMPAFEEFAPEGGLPATQKVAGEIFALPMHPYLTPDQIDYICGVVESAVS
ncbi:MAG: DegT/DnrJ/EryC1/StrS family aminotransferase [Pseudomonadota bacterium]